jgi:hypothetical protein
MCRRYPEPIYKHHKQWCGEHKTKGEIKLLKDQNIREVKHMYNGEDLHK